jgi:hypothetical protein
MWLSIHSVNLCNKTCFVNDTTHLLPFWGDHLGLNNHTQLVRQVMGRFTTSVDRFPMVLFLSGLLFIAGGLLVGFENSLAIASMIFGVLCCVFGVVVFLLQLQESPRKSAATRLSPQFISTGSTVENSATTNVEEAQPTERAAVE